MTPQHRLPTTTAPTFETGTHVTFAGTNFKVGKTPLGGTMLTPIDDPLWWYRHVATNSEIGWGLIVGGQNTICD